MRWMRRRWLVRVQAWAREWRVLGRLLLVLRAFRAFRVGMGFCRRRRRRLLLRLGGMDLDLDPDMDMDMGMEMEMGLMG